MTLCKAIKYAIAIVLVYVGFHIIIFLITVAFLVLYYFGFI